MFSKLLVVEGNGDIVLGPAAADIERIDAPVGVVGVVCGGQDTSAQEATLDLLLQGEMGGRDAPYKPTSHAEGVYAVVVERSVVNAHGETVRQVVLDVGEVTDPRVFAALCVVCSTVAYCAPQLPDDSGLDSDDEEVHEPILAAPSVASQNQSFRDTGRPQPRQSFRASFQAFADQSSASFTNRSLGGDGDKRGAVSFALDTTQGSSPPASPPSHPLRRRRSSGWAMALEAAKIRRGEPTSPVSPQQRSMSFSSRPSELPTRQCVKCGAHGLDGRMYKKGYRCAKCKPRRLPKGMGLLRKVHALTATLRKMRAQSEAEGQTRGAVAMPYLAWVLPREGGEGVVDGDGDRYFLEWLLADIADDRDAVNAMRRDIAGVFPLRATLAPRELRPHVASRLRSKRVGGTPLTGRLLVAVLRGLLGPLSVGLAPPLHQPWADLARRECDALVHGLLFGGGSPARGGSGEEDRRPTVSRAAGAPQPLSDDDTARVWCTVAEKLAHYGASAAPLLPHIRKTIAAGVHRRREADDAAAATARRALEDAVIAKLQRKLHTAPDFPAFTAFVNDCVAGYVQRAKLAPSASAVVATVATWCLEYGKKMHARHAEDLHARCTAAEADTLAARQELAALRERGGGGAGGDGRGSAQRGFERQLNASHAAQGELERALERQGDETAALRATIERLEDEVAAASRSNDELVLRMQQLDLDLEAARHAAAQEERAHDDTRRRLNLQLHEARASAAAAAEQQKMLRARPAAASPVAPATPPPVAAPATPNASLVSSVHLKAQSEHDRTLLLLRKIDMMGAEGGAEEVPSPQPQAAGACADGEGAATARCDADNDTAAAHARARARAEHDAARLRKEQRLLEERAAADRARVDALAAENRKLRREVAAVRADADRHATAARVAAARTLAEGDADATRTTATHQGGPEGGAASSFLGGGLGSTVAHTGIIGGGHGGNDSILAEMAGISSVWPSQIGHAVGVDDSHFGGGARGARGGNANAEPQPPTAAAAPRGLTASLQARFTDIAGEQERVKAALADAEETIDVLRDDLRAQYAREDELRAAADALREEARDAAQREMGLQAAAESAAAARMEALEQLDQVRTELAAVRATTSVSASRMHSDILDGKHKLAETAGKLARDARRHKDTADKLSVMERALTDEQTGRHNEVADLQRALETARSEATFHTKDADTLRDRVKLLEVQLEQERGSAEYKDDQIRTLREENAEAQRCAQEKSDRVDELLADLLRVEARAQEQAAEQHGMLEAEHVLRTQNDEYSHEIRELQRRCSFAANEQQVADDAAAARLARAKEEHSMETARLSTLLQRANEGLQDAEAKCETLELKAQQGAQEVAVERRRVEDITRSLADVERARDAAEAHHAQEMAVVRRQLDQLREGSAAAEGSAGAQLADLRRENDALTTRVDELVQDVQERDMVVSRQTEQIAQMAQREALHKDVARDLEDTRAALFDAKGKVAVLEQQVTQLGAMNTAATEQTSAAAAFLNDERAAAVAEMQRFRQKYKDAKEENGVLQEKLARLAAAEHRLEHDMEVLRQRSSEELQLHDAQAQEAAGPLRAQVAKLQQDLAAGKEAFTQLKQRLRAAERARADGEQKLTSLEAQNRDLATKARMTEEDAAAARKQVDDIRTRLRDEQRRVREVKAELAQAQAKLRQRERPAPAAAAADPHASSTSATDSPTHLIAMQKSLLMRNKLLLAGLDATPPEQTLLSSAVPTVSALSATNSPPISPRRLFSQTLDGSFGGVSATGTPGRLGGR